jgi:hypothetical protein
MGRAIFFPAPRVGKDAFYQTDATSVPPQDNEIKQRTELQIRDVEP